MLKSMLGSSAPRPAANVPQTRTANGRSTSTGKTVTPESALTVPVVLAAITVLAQDSSTLPLIVYKNLDRGKERFPKHYLYPILHDLFNDEMTAQIGRELIVAHIIGWGNFYAQKIVNYAGQLMELWPLNPSRMRIERDKKTGRRVYHYIDPQGKPIDFDQDEIWHVPGFGFDGIQGYSIITLMRNGITLAQTAEDYGGFFYANDARSGVALKSPKKLSDTAYNHLRDSWNDEHAGPENAGKPAIFEEGLDIISLGVPPKDAQYIETRTFQKREFATALRIPPHMLGDVEGSTSWGTGIEQQEQGYVNHTLRPWLVRIEQCAKKDLLLPSERQLITIEHLLDALLRGSTTERFSAYSIALQTSILSPNEVRERENMNPYPGGDTYRAMRNTEPVGKALAPVVQDATARIMRREAHDLLEAARKFAKRSDMVGMTTYLTAFWTDHQQFMTRQLEPVARSMAAAGGWDYTPQALTAFCEHITADHAQVLGRLLAQIKPETASAVMPLLEAQAASFEAQAAQNLYEKFMQHMEQ